MRILGITTSSKTCSVAIIEDEKVIGEKIISDTKTHSEILIPLISQLLSETNINLSSFDYLACDIGPGSFTGIRIGISTIKAFSEITSIPICAVSSLEGLAAQIDSSVGTIVSLIDARNNQAYCGIFDTTYSTIESYIADSIDNIITILKNVNTQITFVGDASILHHDLLYDNFPEANFSNKSIITASNIAKISKIKIANNDLYSADTLLPLYLRKSQAERMKEIQNGTN